MVVLAAFATGQPSPLTEVARALREQRFREAHVLIEGLLKGAPGDARLWTLDGMALEGMGQGRESIRAYDRALAANAGYLPAWLGKAEAQYRLNDAATPTTLRQVLQLDPGNATAHAMLGSLAFAKRDCTTALPHFKQGRAEVLKTGTATWQYAQCLLMAGDAAASAALFERLLAANPADEAARFNLGLALHQSGKYASAIDVLSPLATANPPRSEALGLLASAHERNGAPAEAITILRTAADLFPGEESHYLDLGAICANHNAFDLGIEVLGVGARNVPSSSAVRLLRGLLFVLKGEFASATAEFDRADQLSPGGAAGLIGASYASMFNPEDDPERSIARLRAELSRRPRDAVLNYLLAEALLRTSAQPGDAGFDEALKRLESAVKWKPDFAKARSALGKLYGQQKRPVEAIRELRVAVRLDPTDQVATYRLALALRDAGQDKEPGELFDALRALRAEQRRLAEARQKLMFVKEAPVVRK